MSRSKYGDRFIGWMPRDVVKVLGLRVYNDPEELKVICKKIIENQPKLVEQYRAGKTKIIGRFIKCVMDETKDGADPKLTTEILMKLLNFP